MAIDRTNPTPLYYQLELELLSMIERNEWGPGDLIPTESEICSSYGLSRTTVRQALANLVHQGLLIRRAGKGSYIREKRVMASMGQGLVYGAMQAAGLAPARRVLEFLVEVGDSRVLQELELPGDSQVLRVKRLLLGDERPVVLSESVMPRVLVPTLTLADFEELKTYDVLVREGIHLGSGSVTLEARLAHHEEAELLEISADSPVLASRRVTHLDDGRPFEILVSVCRSDMVVFAAHFDSVDEVYADLADPHSRIAAVVDR